MHLGLRRSQAPSLAQRRRFRSLFIAVGLTVLGGLYLSLGVALRLDLPGVPGDLARGTAVSLLGLSVARHNAREIVDLPRPGPPGPEGLTLLMPLHAGEEQIGALLLGAREADRPYSEEDRLLLDDLAEQVAAVIQATRLQEANAQAISDMVAEFREREHSLQRQMQAVLAEREVAARPALAGVGEKQFISLVEDALRRLHDYPYLGEHTLARLRVVDRCLVGGDEEPVTHLDRGKALSPVLLQALDKLRPAGPEPGPHDVPPREWHAYLILHGAYVRGALNRDLMSWLYVGEGTVNRTRRRAVRAVAQALQEMERAAQR